jgi:hypothetical protein
LIRDSYIASGGLYGSLFADLREAGETCGKHRIERIMRHNKIKAVRGYKSPKAVKGRPSILAPNRVNREFTVDAPDCVWVTGITTFVRGRAGCIWRLSWIFIRVRWWAGLCSLRLPRNWSWMRS